MSRFSPYAPFSPGNNMTADPSTRCDASSDCKCPWRKPRLLVVLLVLAAVLVPLGTYRYFRHNFKRLQELRPGVMYRMGQPSEYGLQRVVDDYGLKTVVCLRDGEPHLRAGMFFEIGKNSGRLEKEAVEELGLRFCHWPLNDEAHWPWPTPWHLEQFYQLMDDPANHPVIVHCMAGKHRAGTLSAIFRLEYDRWQPPRVLEEMYSFRFGKSRSIQEHNIRTYLPRPRPDAGGQEALSLALGPALDGPPENDFEAFLRQLRAARKRPETEAALSDYLTGHQPFALGLARRLIETPEDPLAPVACRLAAECLAQSEAPVCDWQSSAGLIADFGSPEQQQQLLELLSTGASSDDVWPRYAAAVTGVTGGYTRNRIVYLRPLLDDLRERPEPAAQKYRYADTAVARLATILDIDLLGTLYATDRADWDQGIAGAKAWFDEHPEEAQPGPLLLPETPDWAEGQ